MPNYTDNFNLKKPLPSEFYNVEDQNGNMDLIDAAMKVLGVSIAGNSGDISQIEDALASQEVKILDRLICETGSYIGTGTYGADNPTSLSFGIKPKLILIYGGVASGVAYGQSFGFFIAGSASGFIVVRAGSSSVMFLNIPTTWDAHRASWYYYSNASSFSGGYQLNIANATYDFIALGTKEATP